MNFKGFAKTKITSQDYADAWSPDLVVVASVTDPGGQTFRAVTVWGECYDVPVLVVEMCGDKVDYYKFNPSKPITCSNCAACRINQ